MNISAGLVVIAGSALSLAAAAQGQQCLWDYYPGFSNSSSQHEAIYHASSQRVMMVVFYGVGPGGRIFAREGGAWVLVNESGPSQRQESGAVYDAARDRVVVFGGRTSSSQFIGNTVEWDGTDWTVASYVGPAARSGHAMVYDSARQRTVLFGGRNAAGLLGDTWEWDGQAWVQVASTGPAPRELALATFDSGRGRMMLYGGTGLSASLLSDLWEWDGSAWVQRSGSTPGERPAWMAYDSGRGRVLLGRQKTIWFDDYETWELEPVSGDWTLRDPARGNENRGVYDPGEDAVVFARARLNPQALQIAPYVVQRPWGGNIGVGSTIVLQSVFGGSEPISYQWFRDNVALEDGGRISGSTTATLTIVEAEFGDSGWYSVAAANMCAPTVLAYTSVQVMEPGGPCYANCDGSTVEPRLNVADFGCFMQKFAAGDAWANCDQASGQPILNIADFGCFLAKFVAGCP